MDNTARNFVDHLEHDLLEAKNLLQSGLEVALERMRSAAGKATKAMSDQAIAKLRAVEDLSAESIDVIQKHLIFVTRRMKRRKGLGTVNHIDYFSLETL